MLSSDLRQELKLVFAHVLFDKSAFDFVRGITVLEAFLIIISSLGKGTIFLGYTYIGWHTPARIVKRTSADSELAIVILTLPHLLEDGRHAVDLLCCHRTENLLRHSCCSCGPLCAD